MASGQPASPVRENDVIEFYVGETFRRVIVTSIPDRQQPKEIARTMYVMRRRLLRSPTFPCSAIVEAGDRQKRERRDMEEFIRRSADERTNPQPAGSPSA